jgi:hypothetical protein
MKGSRIRQHTRFIAWQLARAIVDIRNATPGVPVTPGRIWEA